MKTIGYGLVQIPIVTRYHVCCIKRTLAGGVTSTGWQQILGCTLRILLLSAWGLQSIDYSLPQTAEKLIGIYIEYAILATLLGNGIVVLIALWSNNLYLFYPALIIIPVGFVTDIVIKATCYAALFLTPKVTSFGILSLIEVWFRGLSLMYGWIIIISYVHYKRKDWELADVDVHLTSAGSQQPQPSLLKRGSSQGKSPFSRNSSLSQRGRRSFLLRYNPTKAEKDSTPVGVMLDDETPENVQPLADNESEVLLGESATMSLTRTPGPPFAGSEISSPSYGEGNRTGVIGPNVSSSPCRSPPRYKKRGGFVPEVLRTASIPGSRTNLEVLSTESRYSAQRAQTHSGSTVSGNTIQISNAGNSTSQCEYASLIPPKQTQSKSRNFPLKVDKQPIAPPALPDRPPVGKRKSLMKAWFKKGGDSKSSPERSAIALDHKHVQEPVFV